MSFDHKRNAAGIEAPAVSLRDMAQGWGAGRIDIVRSFVNNTSMAERKGSKPVMVAPGVRLPAAALRFTFARSGGPGGQHANKASTRATLNVPIEDLREALPPDAMQRLADQAGSKLTSEHLILTAAGSRSQRRRPPRLHGQASRTARRRPAPPPHPPPHATDQRFHRVPPPDETPAQPAQSHPPRKPRPVRAIAECGDSGLRDFDRLDSHHHQRRTSTEAVISSRSFGYGKRRLTVRSTTLRLSTNECHQCRRWTGWRQTNGVRKTVRAED